MDEIVVVGAGPAGASAALMLARAGVPVRIIERSVFPRRKACGEYLAPGAVAALRELGVDKPVRREAMLLRGVRVHADGAAPIALPFEREAVAIARERLDTLLLDAACDAGAVLTLGVAVDIERNAAGRVCAVRVRDRRGESTTFPAAFVVGADGAGSLIARKLGLTRRVRGTRKFAIGGHYRTEGDRDGVIQMYVRRGRYLAINPLGAACANVMAVVPQPEVARWTARIDAAGLDRIGKRVTIGPLAHRTRGVRARGALLVGDAAGFLDPFTGQGVYVALRSGIDAAAAIARSVRDPIHESAELARYAAARSRDAAARRRLSFIVNAVLRRPALARRVAQRLPVRPLAAQRFIDALTGITEPRVGFSLPVLAALFL